MTNPPASFLKLPLLWLSPLLFTLAFPAYPQSKMTIPSGQSIVLPIQGSRMNNRFTDWVQLNSNGEVVKGITEAVLPAYPDRANVGFKGEVDFDGNGLVENGILVSDYELAVAGGRLGVTFKGGTLVRFGSGVSIRRSD